MLRMLKSRRLAGPAGGELAWNGIGAAAQGTLALVFAGFVVRAAWMSDDAYITLRTVDNFIGGRGLTWNPVERVQAYTHPLWMLLLSGAYALTHEAFYTTLCLSIVLALATCALVVFRLARSPAAGIFAAGALALSKAFVDYSTSGLENTLTHLLLAAFCAVFLVMAPTFSTKRLWLLAFLSGLLAVNRLDTILLILPALGYALLEYGNRRRECILRGSAVVALGFIPLLLWEAFSTIYYGFSVPNTYFAKLTTGVTLSQLISLGVTYFVASTHIDPVTSAMIAAGLIVAARQRQPRHLFLAFGILLYLLYTVRVGGDFMAGRFLTAPFLCAVIIIVSAPGATTGYARLTLPVVIMLLLAVSAPRSPVFGDTSVRCHIDDMGPLGVADERGCYFQQTGLLQQKATSKTVPRHPLAEEGLRQRSGLSPVSISGAIGMYAFYNGPEKHVVDLNALADPLLARLPIPDGKPWRIGHFERLIPAGYLETLVTGQNRICDPNLAAYYDRLALITRGPLFGPERLAAIWQMNTHGYDTLVRSYDATRNAADQLCNAQGRPGVIFRGGPRLAGYSISANRLRPGDRMRVNLYWQGLAEGKSNLASFVHIRNSEPGMAGNPLTGNDIWAQEEHYAPGGRFTSEYWPAQVYADLVDLQLSDSMPAGTYMVEAGWFDPKSGEQLEPDPDTVSAPLKINWRSVMLPALEVR